jgi:ribosome-associated toxin RatA of RatAB toxin-antitoxin module
MPETVRVELSVGEREPEAAFDFVLNVDNYAKLMPNVNSVHIVEQSDGQRITHWDTEIEHAPLIWTERDFILPARFRIEFDCIEGDFEIFRGCWEVVPSDHKSETQVACEIAYSVGIPVIEDIIGPVLRQKITENLTMMLQGLARGISGST